MRGDWWSEWLLRYRSPAACPHKRRQQQPRLRVDAFGRAKLSTTNVEPPQRTSACATAILKAATAPVPPSRATAYPAMQSLGAVESEDHPPRQPAPTMLPDRPCPSWGRARSAGRRCWRPTGSVTGSTAPPGSPSGRPPEHHPARDARRLAEALRHGTVVAGA